MCFFVCFFFAILDFWLYQSQLTFLKLTFHFLTLRLYLGLHLFATLMAHLYSFTQNFSVCVQIQEMVV